jgi:selenide,water dikinase
LAQVLRNLPPVNDPRLLVGHASFDDAGVYALTDDIALVQTIDFFPPMIDDPYLYGQVAAANSLSDVYAMGGDPLTALSFVCFPSTDLDLGILGEILRGAGEKCAEAHCTIVGGHSVRDPEIKFGLSVTGTIHPKKIASNAGAKVGDRLILTKAIGVGPLTTAYRKGVISDELMGHAVKQMATLNKVAAEVMRAFGVNDAVHAATDITGFGLLGHARNIAVASRVKIVFDAKAVPLLPGARDFAAQKLSTGAYKQNQSLLEGLVEVPVNFDEILHRIFYDAETSGGLLISVAPERSADLLNDLHARGVSAAVEVGWVEAPGAALLKIV